MRHIFLPVAALLAGCATLPLAEAPSAGPYRALGTEPFWSVTIADGRLIWETPDFKGIIYVCVFGKCRIHNGNSRSDRYAWYTRSGCTGRDA